MNATLAAALLQAAPPLEFRSAHHRLRVLFQQRLGLPTTLSEDELARELHARIGVSPEEYEALVLEIQAARPRSISPQAFRELTVRLALIERRVLGQ